MKIDNYKVGEFIAVYTDMDNDKFGVGKIVAVNAENIIIHSIDPSGVESGLTLYRNADIFKIEKNTQYCKRILSLMKHRNTILSGYEQFACENLVVEILELAKISHVFVSVQLLNSHSCDVFGYVVSINEEVCEIMQYDNYGIFDGYCSFSIEDISSLKYNDADYRDIAYLAQGDGVTVLK